MIVGVLWIGYERREPGWVQLALAFFALEVLSRYVELLWERLPMEVFFLSAELSCWAAVLVLERVRRTLLQKTGGERVRQCYRFQDDSRCSWQSKWR